MFQDENKGVQLYFQLSHDKSAGNQNYKERDEEF